MKKFIEIQNGFSRRNELVNLDNVTRFERMGDNKARIYFVDGHEVKIVHEVVQFLGDDGKTLFTERLTDFTRKAIKKRFPTLDTFRGAWREADKKQAILDELSG